MFFVFIFLKGEVATRDREMEGSILVAIEDLWMVDLVGQCSKPWVMKTQPECVILYDGLVITVWCIDNSTHDGWKPLRNL